MMIVSRRNKIMEDNKRKMMEVQWRLKLAKISTHIHKDKIRNIKWRIGGDWANRKFHSVSRKTKGSNFEEKNYIWRTTKNVKYTISKADLDKIPKEEIYETEDAEGKRKLVRKRIIHSQAKSRGKRSLHRRGRGESEVDDEMRDINLPEKRNDLNQSEIDNSSFFIPETPKNEYENYINRGDTIDEDYSQIEEKPKKRRKIEGEKEILKLKSKRVLIM